MAFSEDDYRALVIESRKSILEADAGFDNLEERVKDLLMYTPGLGPYIRKKKHTPFASEKLASDIIRGIE